jgi:proteasome alpha subunit
MLLDEPYRWAETVANRREYLEDQLRGGSPVLGLPYDDGALLLTFGRGGSKLFEIYDRVAFGAIGHPADIERLRLAAVDMAHVDGFTNSVDDVSLQRLVNFGVAPLVKNAFDEVLRAPYIIRILMAEIGPAKGARFYTIDCDGTFECSERCGAVAGTRRAAEAMRACVEASGAEGRGLAEALALGLRAWALGRKVDRAEEEGQETSRRDRAEEGREVPEPARIEDREVGEILREETRAPEVAVLTRSRLSKSKFRALTGEEIRAGMSKYL